MVERGRVRPGDPRHRREPGARLRRQQRRHGALRPRWPERSRGQQRVREPQDHLRRGREREPRERRRRAQGQGRPRGVGGGDREPRRHVVDRQGLPLQPEDHRGRPDGDHRSGAWPRPAQDRRRPGRGEQSRHVEQLRQWPDALGNLSRLRGELQRLLLLERPRDRGRRRVQALRHRPQGLGIRVGDGGRAIRHREASQRAEPRGLRGGDRPPGSGLHPEEADRPRALQARERGGGRRRQRTGGRLHGRRRAGRVPLSSS